MSRGSGSELETNFLAKIQTNRSCEISAWDKGFYKNHTTPNLEFRTRVNQIHQKLNREFAQHLTAFLEVELQINLPLLPAEGDGDDAPAKKRAKMQRQMSRQMKKGISREHNFQKRNSNSVRLELLIAHARSSIIVRQTVVAVPISTLDRRLDFDPDASQC